MFPSQPGGDGATARYLFIGSDRGVGFVDGSIEQLWGLSATALRDQPGLWLERVHPDDRWQVAAALDGPSGSSWDFDYRVQRPDGTVVWVHDRGRALNTGRTRQVAGRVVDVTLQRQLEERVRFHAQLLDAAGEAVIAVDLQGAVSSWNPAAERLLGWSAVEALGRAFVKLAFAPASRDDVDALLDLTLAGRNAWSGELQLQRRSGEVAPARFTLSPLTAADGEVTGAVVVAVDVGDLRAAQARAVESEREQRRLVEQLRRLTTHLQVVREQEQTRIAREVHDELGQLLTGLKLDVAWLRRRTAANGDLGAAKLQERLAGLAQLVDQTLDAVRHIAGQLRPPALDDLGLETAIEWLSEEVRSRTGIAVEVRCELDSEPAPGPADTAAFRIVQEALTNVARHAEATRAVVSVRHAGGALVIEVVDDGRGVPRAALRGPRALGILGMRERAHACGGELTVRRLARGGTRVRARLPVAASGEPRGEPAAGRPANGAVAERVEAEAPR